MVWHIAMTTWLQKYKIKNSGCVIRKCCGNQSVVIKCPFKHYSVRVFASLIFFLLLIEELHVSNINRGKEGSFLVCAQTRLYINISDL